jgi:predicted RNase H-like HicB family nuclease
MPRRLHIHVPNFLDPRALSEFDKEHSQDEDRRITLGVDRTGRENCKAPRLSFAVRQQTHTELSYPTSKAMSPPRKYPMHNEFTAIIECDDEWYIAYCLEIPGANGQGKTKDEARASLAAALALILEDRREDALRGVPADL